MRARISEYELVAAQDVAGALALVAEGWKPIAGGTDLMVLLQGGKLAARRLVSLWKLAELRRLDVGPEWVSLGALTTYTHLQRDAVMQREFGLLCRAAGWTGSVANQNRGTIGGNIANASPAADSPPVLLVYEAELELVSPRGSRRVAYGKFHTGYKTSVLAADELIARVWLPRPQGERKEYLRKVGARQAQAISKICFAAVKVGGEYRIAIGSVAPTAIRCPRTEELLGRGESAKEMLMSEIAPIDDMRSTEDYRRRVTGNLLEEFLRVVA